MSTHPTKWYIPLTPENYDEVKAWWVKQVKESGWSGRNLDTTSIVLSKHPTDESHYWLGAESTLNNWFSSYKKITLEQFRQITKQKPMTKSIQISRELLNEYYDAATTPQREYLSEHFKLDGTTTDEAIRGLHQMACDTWKPRIKKNHPECFPEDSKYFDFSNYLKEHGYGGLVSRDIADLLGIRSNFIQIRKSENPKTHARSFYLTTDYNWELVQEESVFGETAWVLIPTKKQS